MLPLQRSFYLRPTLKVARNILGKTIVCFLGKKVLSGIIVETEAYCMTDPASHSFRGKTNRNEVMFGEEGHLYVYFTYGMHFCANIVTGREGIGDAVLIRAVEPLSGIEIMTKNRCTAVKSLNRKSPDRKLLNLKSPDRKSLNRKLSIDLTNGPAKFCQAFGIGRKENGLDLLNSRIIITNGIKIPSNSIGISTRIGINFGTERKWRFFIKNNPWVSR